jgi:hypothetical protein
MSFVTRPTSGDLLRVALQGVFGASATPASPASPASSRTRAKR